MKHRVHDLQTGEWTEHESDHDATDHPVEGDAAERARAVIARHLCGWMTGHDGPVDHFLVDADQIIADVRSAGVTFADAAVRG